MSDRSPNITTNDPFGSLLGYAPGGVAIYSSDYNTADEKEFPNDAAFRSYVGREYMGYKWQCVEFARRYLYSECSNVFATFVSSVRIFSSSPSSMIYAFISASDKISDFLLSLALS